MITPEFSNFSWKFCHLIKCKCFVSHLVQSVLSIFFFVPYLMSWFPLWTFFLYPVVLCGSEIKLIKGCRGLLLFRMCWNCWTNWNWSQIFLLDEMKGFFFVPPHTTSGLGEKVRSVAATVGNVKEKKNREGRKGKEKSHVFWTGSPPNR